MASDGQRDYPGGWVYSSTYSDAQPWALTDANAVQVRIPPTYDQRLLGTVKVPQFESVDRCCAMTYDSSGKGIAFPLKESPKDIGPSMETLPIPQYKSVDRCCAMTYDSSGLGIVTSTREEPE